MAWHYTPARDRPEPAEDRKPASGPVRRHRVTHAEVRRRTGWDRAPAIDGHAFLAPHIGALCIGVRSNAGTGRDVTLEASNHGHADREAPQDIWQIPLGRPGPILAGAVFRAAVQLLAYVAPVTLVRVPEGALGWYLETPLSPRERAALRSCKWTPAPLRVWADGMQDGVQNDQPRGRSASPRPG